MTNCIFCRIVSREEPALIIYEDKTYLAFLDKYPQNPGHLQLIPKKHYRWIYDLPRMGEIFAVAQNIIRAIIPVLKANHITLGCYGHQVEHAHIWIMPQYDRQELVGEWGNRRNLHNSDQNLALLLKTQISKEVSRVT